MSKLIPSFWENFGGGKEMRILMVGLDGAGKTTILSKASIGEIVTTVPTNGFNIENVSHKNLTFTAWTVGGQDTIRPLWRHYFQGAWAVVYVVDSDDRGRFAEARDELSRMLNEDELRDAIFLVFANKQDLPNASPPAEISENLDLNKMSSRTWHIQGTIGTQGDGLYEGMDWLSNALKTKT